MVVGVLLVLMTLWRSDDRSPLLVWNATESLPTGLYLIRSGYQLGDIVAFDIPETIRDLVAERGWLPESAYLLKRVVAQQGDEVCVRQQQVFINGVLYDRLSKTDSLGRPMPQLAGCRLLEVGQLWVMLPDNSLSLDSRYFGVVSVRDVYGRATQVW